MILRRQLHIAAAVFSAIGAARGEVFELQGTPFPNNYESRLAFATTVLQGDSATFEGVFVDAPSLQRPEGLGVAMMPTRGPWPGLYCSGTRVVLDDQMNTSGALLVQLEAGTVGTGGAELGVAGPWSVVVANCGKSQGGIIAGGSVSVRSPHGFLPAHEQTTISVQAGFAVVYIVLWSFWERLIRHSAGKMAKPPQPPQVIASLILVCASTTLATLCALCAKQQMSGFMSLDFCSVAQALRFSQVLLAFSGVAVGAARFGISSEGMVKEFAAVILGVSLVVPFNSLQHHTADLGDRQGFSGGSLPALVMLAGTTVWVLCQMSRRMRELREATVAEEKRCSARSLSRLRVSLLLFVSVLLCAVLAMLAMMTALRLLYRDFVISEQVATAVVLAFLMAIWAGEADMEESTAYAAVRQEGSVNDLSTEENGPGFSPSPFAIGAPTDVEVE